MVAFSLSEPLLALRTVLAAGPLRRSLLAYLMFNTAEWAVWVAVLVFAYDFGGTTATAVAAVAQLLPAAIIAPLVASLGDRAPRERLLSWTYLLQAAMMALTVLLFMLDASPPWILIGAVLVSVSISLSRPVYLATLPAFAGNAAQLTAANSVSTMAESLALLVGPAIAAAVAALAGTWQVFGLFAVGQLIAALLVRRRTHADPGMVNTERSRIRLSDATDALAELRAFPSGLLLIGYAGVAFLLVGMADVLAVVLAFEILDLGPSGPGVLISAMGFGGIAGAAASIMLAGRRRLGPALTGSLLLAGAPFALAGLSTQLLAVVLLLAAAGAGKSLLDVAARTLLQRSVDEDVLVRAFGLQEGLMMLALAVGALAVPLLVGLFGPRGAFVTAGLMLPVLAALTWPRLRSIDAAAQPPPLSLALLRRVPMFGYLPAPVLERVASRMLPVEFRAGDTVIRQGDSGEHFYVVESGQLEVTVDGQPRPTLGPGDSFGEIAMMRDVPRTASICAVTEARLWALDRETFLAAITGSRRVEAAAARVADTRLTATQTTGIDAPGYRSRRRR
jgi:MFS family permease